MPDAVKQRYLEARPGRHRRVTTRVDGMPHRVLRTGLVEKLESGSRVRRVSPQRVRNAGRFKKMSGMTLARSMVRDGLAMRHGKELTWSQVVMAANTPMLLRAGLVEGNTDAGRAGLRSGGRHPRRPAVVRELIERSSPTPRRSSASCRRPSPTASPAEFVQPIVVEAEMVPELVDDGDPHLVDHFFDAVALRADRRR